MKHYRHPKLNYLPEWLLTFYKWLFVVAVIAGILYGSYKVVAYLFTGTW